jgi:hypothetical protein
MWPTLTGTTCSPGADEKSVVLDLDRVIDQPAEHLSTRSEGPDSVVFGDHVDQCGVDVRHPDSVTVHQVASGNGDHRALNAAQCSLAIEAP